MLLSSLTLSFEKLKPTTFLKLSVQNDTYINIDCVTKVYANHLPGVQVMAEIKLQCKTLHKHIQVF